MARSRLGQELNRRRPSRIGRGPPGWALILLLCLAFVQPTPAFARGTTSAQEGRSAALEIHYDMPEAGEVSLIWGVNGWGPVPEEERPPGTMVLDGVMHTPMAHRDDTFVATVKVPLGTAVDYGFLITETRDGIVVKIWEGDDSQDYHTVAYADRVLEVKTKLESIGPEGITRSADAPLVRQEIRYHMPEAGQVALIWGVDGWGLVSEEIRPTGTIVKNQVMHTPMARLGQLFVARIQVPAGASVDYGFLITKKRDGTAIEAVWDGREEYRAIANRDSAIEVQGRVNLSEAERLPTLWDAGLYLLGGVGLLAVIGLALSQVSLHGSRRAVLLALVALTVLGLLPRLWMADTTERLRQEPAQLIGDEPRYDTLAVELLQGRFFQQPIATPVYPLFLAASYLVAGHSYLAALYAQAVLGAGAIPLTYLLARRLTGAPGALFAAALVAVSPPLINHVGYLYTEVLYTALLLLSLLSLLWALQAPSFLRFAVGGLLLGISALCRPAAAVFSATLPALLPRHWSFGRRLALWASYGGAVAAVVAPWAYHNYRTYDTFMPFSLSMATLWQGSPEFYHLMHHQEDAMITIWDKELNPERNGGINPITIEGDHYFNARAVASIRDEPQVYLQYSLQKLLYFWVGHPAANYDWPFNLSVLRTYYSAAGMAGIFGTRLLLVLAGLVSLFVLRRRLNAFMPLLLLCVSHMLVYAALVPLARHGEPLYPILATLVAAAVAQMLTKHLARGRQGAELTPANYVGTQPDTLHSSALRANRDPVTRPSHRQ